MHNSQYAYHNYASPDPPHQPLYLQSLLAQLAAADSVRSVLDVGCGDGNFTQSIAEAGYQTYGIDLSAGGIAIARSRPKCGGRFAVASVYDDLRSVFEDRSEFDAAVSIEVVEHLYAPREYARRIHETVRPGGIVIITTPYWGYAKNIALAVSNRMDRALTPLWDGGHIKHWSYRTLRQLFEEASFEYVAFAGAGRPIPYLWKGMLMVFRKTT